VSEVVKSQLFQAGFFFAALKGSARSAACGLDQPANTFCPGFQQRDG
jgi:hypothetical protein